MPETRTCFPPVVGTHPRVLILGSMPGEASLARGQYYAHPQNSFWPLMAEILGFPADAPYPERLECLKQHDVALWDVIGSCRREGSADTAIEPDSIRVNDFATFFAQHPSLRHVLFNGRKAEQEFRRRVLRKGLVDEGRVQLMLMPSTSPAYAVLTRRQKYGQWKLLRKLLNA